MARPRKPEAERRSRTIGVRVATEEAAVPAERTDPVDEGAATSPVGDAPARALHRNADLSGSKGRSPSPAPLYDKG